MYVYVCIYPLPLESPFLLPIHPLGCHRTPEWVPWVIQQLPTQFSSVAQLCLALCDPMDCSMPGFPVHLYQMLFLSLFYKFVIVKNKQTRTQFLYTIIHKQLIT